MEKLFADWVSVVQKLKKLPSMNEYHMLSQYSSCVLMRRFGRWRNVPQGLKRFAATHNLAGKFKRELALVKGAPVAKSRQPAAPARPWPSLIPDRPVYGQSMSFGPMAYAPVNELGVVFLFGAMAWQLGFLVHRLHADFPDCEAMRRVAEDKCQLVKIEFEIESRNFLRHHHDASKCDLIVCWKHNWPDCPLEVLELRKLVGEQSLARGFFPDSEATCVAEPASA
jgi:hypothetical protein